MDWAIKTELQELESVIERGLQGFYEAGQALRRIRDERLYLKDYKTFEDYCVARWRFKRDYACRLISAVQVADNLRPTGSTPETERQARPLKWLAPEQQRQAWQAAQQIGGEQPKSEDIERAARAVATSTERSAIQPGDILSVVQDKSPYYGERVEVLDVEGVIVTARTAAGEKPFLITELIPAQEPAALPVRGMPTKTDRMAIIEALLDAERERVKVLETQLQKLIVAAQSKRLSVGLLEEAQALLGLSP